MSYKLKKETDGAIDRVESKLKDQELVYAGSEALAFSVYQMPPTTKIYTYVNGVHVTQFTAPVTTGAKMGDDIFTDQQGNAAGYLYIPSSDGRYRFLTGELRVTFGDNPNGITYCRNISETILYNHGNKLVDINQGSTVSLRTLEKIRNVNRNQGEDYLVTGVSPTDTSKLDVMAQSFFVDETKNPNGIFLTGVNLFFYAKDTLLPVAIELRPMTNGDLGPSSTEYFSGSFVQKLPQDIELYNPASAFAAPTEFTFDHPIYLKPGTYAFCVLTKSDKYKILTAKTGDGKTVKQPFAGQLYRSQSLGIWQGDVNEDMTFALRKAKFETGTKTFILKNNGIAPIEYNRFRLISSQLSLGDTGTTQYRVKTKSAGGLIGDYRSVLPSGSADVVGRQSVEDEGDITVEVSMTSKSQDVSPMIDKQLLKAQITRNNINPYSEEISNSELKASNGSAKSRYIGKIVTLQEDFDSTGLEVTLDVNRKTGTDIEVFCRVMARDDKNLSGGIEERPWTRMPLVLPIRKSFAGANDDLFVTETYRLLDPNLNYSYVTDTLSPGTPKDANYKNFAFYQIKIVFYASTDKYLPKIKNLSAVALV